MTYDEARARARATSETLRDMVELSESVKDESYVTMQIFKAYNKPQFYYRLRQHDASGTYYGANRKCTKREAAIAVLLGLTPWHVDEISKRYLKGTHDNLEKHLSAPAVQP